MNRRRCRLHRRFLPSMAIALEFLDFIVPVALIRERYPGGWDRCLADHEELLGRRVWHDQHLFRDGAMSPYGIQSLALEWERLGFQGPRSTSTGQVFRDFCVVESLFGGPTLPCSWIRIEPMTRSAYLAGTNPDAVMGRRRA